MTEPKLSRRDLGRLTTNLVASSILGGSMLDPYSLAQAEQVVKKGPLPQMIARLVPFASAPFPYHGIRPDTGAAFLDISAEGRRGHTSLRGGVYFEDQTYSDSRVLVALPAGFDPHKKAAIVVFFHGNNATLERDVIGRQRVLDQLQASTLNAALIAPQFAFDALDSSSGNFWQPNGFARFMSEAAKVLAGLLGAPDTRTGFARLPIILVAFSGGYNPAAFVVTVGGVEKRVMGLVLLDAIYAETSRFKDWIGESRRSAFFLSAYSEVAEDENLELQRKLKASRIAFSTGVPQVLLPGEVTFLPTPGVDHVNYVTSAWVDDPLTWVFNRVPKLAR